MDASNSSSMSFDDEQEEPDVEPSDSPSGGEVKWEVVTKTSGLAPAEIIAQRLQSEGIPARSWQEGAGQAFGLTVGLLGDGYVIVPETYLDQATAILAEPVDVDDIPFDEDE